MSDKEVGSIIKVAKRPVGRPHKIGKPEDLWNLFVSYCEYVDSNPWQSKTASNSLNDKSSGSKDNFIRQEVKVLSRAYTLYGFCAYAGIFSKWGDFKRTNINRKGFADVINAIENIVCAQQVDGALINQFDGSLVARLNGFADKQVNEIVGKDGEKFEFPKLTVTDLEELKRINGL